MKHWEEILNALQNADTYGLLKLAADIVDLDVGESKEGETAVMILCTAALTEELRRIGETLHEISQNNR